VRWCCFFSSSAREIGASPDDGDGEGLIFEEEGGFSAMMVELLKQMHLQKEVAGERAAREGARRKTRARRSSGRRIVTRPSSTLFHAIEGRISNLL
jgi:hypothetical protein